MEIQENNGIYTVIENGQEVYQAQSIDEAQGYIDWKTRPDSGNPDDCVSC